MNFAFLLEILEVFLEKSKVPFNPTAIQPAVETTQVAEMTVDILRSHCHTQESILFI